MAILVVLYRRIGWADMVEEMGKADPTRLIAALLLFIPQVLVMAWRWQLIGSTAAPLGFRDACRMVLAGSSLNVVLPSHLGDMCKGLMLGDKVRHGVAGGLGLAMLDKLMDTLGLAVVLAAAGFFASKTTPLVLLFWAATCVGAVMLVVVLHVMRPLAREPKRRVVAALARGFNAAFEVRQRRAIWAGSLLLSVLLWALHVGQIYVFYLAVAGPAPLPVAEIFMRVPMAIFIGLLPLTLAGIGTRDGVLVMLIEPHEVAALVGLFCTLRYVVMAVLGVPAIVSLGPHLTRALERARRRTE
ncbi:MAG: flippase-like domain-containing protein [Verrucomicrobia bacterium]|nr:flippase-like domain-containing protein [Verrucomicrobiota bacterium]